MLLDGRARVPESFLYFHKKKEKALWLVLEALLATALHFFIGGDGTRKEMYTCTK